jgi:hypothetical protein
MSSSTICLKWKHVWAYFGEGVNRYKKCDRCHVTRTLSDPETA